MDAHGDLLTEALGDQGSFAAATLPALADYGQALWRRKQANDDIPRLEALVKDVDRLQKVWQDTYVSDQVFEFLFRRIDMFNMRDSATPAGILLYGHPGNGKAHLAKKIAESLSAKFSRSTRRNSRRPTTSPRCGKRAGAARFASSTLRTPTPRFRAATAIHHARRWSSSPNGRSIIPARAGCGS